MTVFPSGDMAEHLQQNRLFLEYQDSLLLLELYFEVLPSVLEEELPLLKEKYKRGQNASEKDGAGLGLFLTNYFITNMDGKLTIQNGEPGLIVRLFLRTV